MRIEYIVNVLIMHMFADTHGSIRLGFDNVASERILLWGEFTLEIERSEA